MSGPIRLQPLARSRVASLGESGSDRLAILADALAQAWEVTARLAHAPPRPGEDKASQLIAMITELWSRLGRPCSRDVVDHAVDAAQSLVTVDPADLAVVHGDPHPGQPAPGTAAPAGGGERLLLVDPDGFVADRAYDLGVAPRDWTGRLEGRGARALLESYCAVLAERSGVDAERTWRWGYVERVSTGLYVLSLGSFCRREAVPGGSRTASGLRTDLSSATYAGRIGRSGRQFEQAVASSSRQATISREGAPTCSTLRRCRTGTGAVVGGTGK